MRELQKKIILLLHMIFFLAGLVLGIRSLKAVENVLIGKRIL